MIHGGKKSGVITSTIRACNGRSRGQSRNSSGRNGRLATRFGIVSRRISSKLGPTSERCKRSHVNAPVDTTILTDDDLIEVVDPTHPLFGRRFQVVRLCPLPRGEGFVDVFYREHIRLRIPLDATDRATSLLARRATKLTLEGIKELIALAKECQPSCRNNPASSGPGFPKT